MASLSSVDLLIIDEVSMLRADLRFARIDDIIKQGLHEYLTQFLDRIIEIGEQINVTYFWSAES